MYSHPYHQLPSHAINETAGSDMPKSHCIAFFTSSNKKSQSKAGEEEIQGFKSSTESMKIANHETQPVNT